MEWYSNWKPNNKSQEVEGNIIITDAKDNQCEGWYDTRMTWTWTRKSILDYYLWCMKNSSMSKSRNDETSWSVWLCPDGEIECHYHVVCLHSLQYVYMFIFLWYHIMHAYIYHTLIWCSILRKKVKDQVNNECMEKLMD